MTPEFFDKEILQPTFKRLTELSQTKGKEYTQGEDRLKNFYSTGTDIDLPPIKVLYIFMKKHWDAIKSYIKFGAVQSEEHINGRIDDMILYLILLKGLIHEKEERRP